MNEFINMYVLEVCITMEEFAVAVCKGLAMKKMSWKNAVIVGLWFGTFQALMPVIGYFLGVSFADRIKSVDHWIAFVLLALIGGNMIREAFGKEEERASADLDVKTMFIMAVATSIDALAVGVTFAFLNQNMPLAVSLIGVTTFMLSMLGVKVGNLFGVKYKSKAEFIGGLILILLGAKILLEHLGIISI